MLYIYCNNFAIGEFHSFALARHPEGKGCLRATFGQFVYIRAGADAVVELMRKKGGRFRGKRLGGGWEGLRVHVQGRGSCQGWAAGVRG